MSQELYNYIVSAQLDTSDVIALAAQLRAETTMRHIEKSVVNNFIVNNNLNLKLRAITNEPVPHAQYDAVIPNSGGLTVRLAAQAGLDWLLAESGAQVNPNNANLQNLIGLLQSVGVFTEGEVAAFWDLFKTPKWPELQSGVAESRQMVRAALNTPFIDETKSVIDAANAAHSTLLSAESELQAQRQNDIAQLNKTLSELSSGQVVDVPTLPEWAA